MGSSTREALAGMTLVPGIYDAFSAMIAERVGHRIVYYGSFAAQASALGMVDARFITMTEMVEHTRRIVEAVNIPVLVDMENGFGNALQVQRTVAAFEAAGAMGGHLEDHEFGKHTRFDSVVVPTPVMIDKITAALEARKSPDFKIIARTDALQRLGLEDAVDRLGAYAEAGADMVFMAGAGTRELEALAKAVRVPIVNTNAYGNAQVDGPVWEALGVRFVLFFATALQVIYPALAALFASLKAQQLPVSEGITLAELEQFMDYDAYQEKASRLLARSLPE